ncbi:MAG: hypothetical protein JWP47_599 [Polaromonas sp.]|jgi:hypothetical protein|nr:hypothetical protein [Polaromonas sp.]
MPFDALSVQRFAQPVIYRNSSAKKQIYKPGAGLGLT